MSVEYSQAVKMLKGVKKAIKNLDEFYADFITQCGLEIIADTKMNTPVRTGELRNKWELSDVVRGPGWFGIVLINSQEYASFVEYGHSQQPGRYVPAIKKKLVKSWVNGQFMCTKALEKMQQELDAKLNQAFSQYLKECGVDEDYKGSIEW